MEEELCAGGIVRLADISIIDNLDTTSLTAVKLDTSVSRAAELLMDVHNPFLIYESDENERKEYQYIITPWDVVMKLLRPDHVTESCETLSSFVLYFFY
jgi:hypothetical protein